MKILIEFNGSWGLGDKFLADPIYQHLKKIYGKDTIIHVSGDSGVSSHNPFCDGQKQDLKYDKIIPINCFDKMPAEEYQKLEALPSAIGHMLSYAGIDYTKVDKIRPSLYLSKEEKENAFNKFLKGLSPQQLKNLIVMCIDYYDPRRHLAIGKWDKIASLLKQKGYTIVNLGLYSHLKKADIDLAGKTTLREAGAVLSYASLFIGNNSFLFHIAQSLSVPCVCTFSLAIPERFVHGTSPVYPVQADIKCKNCMTFDMLQALKKKGQCLKPWWDFGKCMRMITVNMLMRKIEEALNDRKSRHNL